MVINFWNTLIYVAVGLYTYAAFSLLTFDFENFSFA